MLDLSKYRMVDLSPLVVAGVTRMDGTVEVGVPDAMGVALTCEEKVGGLDNTKHLAYGGNGHIGSHTEGGKTHIDHWENVPETMKGIWEMPLETFYGPAAVCDMSFLTPAEEGKYRGQAILPEHLGNVETGDIVLIWSSHTELRASPHIPAETAEWLAAKKVKMLAAQFPGVIFDTNPTGSENNSPTHRNLLGNNIPLTYPLANMEQLKHKRVFYMGLPLRYERMDASCIRAIAIEEI